MKILYFSDIHGEIRESETRIPWISDYPLDLGPCLKSYIGSVDLVIMAGDIATIRERREVSTLNYAAQVASYLGCHVIVVPGNHEYYGGVFETDRRDLLAAKVENVTVLDRHEAVFEFGGKGLRVLGATLWTDYRACGDQALAMLDARGSLNDHRTIRNPDGSYFAPQQALAEHELSRAWLLDKIRTSFDGFTLVATHHVPHSAARHPLYGMNRLSPMFYSDCNDLIEAASEMGVAGMIFGHHHWSMAIDVAGVPLLSAQFGYPREKTNWIGPGVLDL